jgi:hypothetical protein
MRDWVLARDWNGNQYLCEWNVTECNNTELLIQEMELLVQEMDNENEGDANNLDDYLMGFWEGDDMDVDTCFSFESDDPIADFDFGEDDTFDVIGTLLPLTVVYGNIFWKICN